MISFEQEKLKSIKLTWRLNYCSVYHNLIPTGRVSNLTVTASYAIFRRDGGNEAPGSVVGFHLSHSALFDRFRDVTAKTNVSFNL